MEDSAPRAIVCGLLMVVVLLTGRSPALAQNYERYKPRTLPETSQPQPEIPKQDLPESTEDDRVLVERLDAVIIVDDVSKISMNPEIDELAGLHRKISDSSSLVHRREVDTIVNRYIGQSITLRQINLLTRDLIRLYQRCDRPIVDVLVPEQRITGGTLHVVVIEARVGRVLIEPGCVFECDELDRWIECTQPGDRLRESRLKNDLFWLNQNPFRRVTVDFKPGESSGTTDVIFESHDVTPIRGYLGADDSGVQSLNYGRMYSGLMYGNMFGRGGLLSYQYTTDQEFSRLKAHSASLNQPLSRDYSLSTYGSWAEVSPVLGAGLTQGGQSWQTGIGMTHHLIRSYEASQNLTLGLDFKSTNNNLEFAGSTVASSNADLVQLHLGFDDLMRADADQYSLWRIDSYVGPGGGMTGSNSAAAFQTIRPGTSPDYIYGRIMTEQAQLLNDNTLLVVRLTGQVASERLLFSEMLGLGGHDNLRGYDPNAFNADHGWIGNFELGPKMYRWGRDEDQKTLRPYVFMDMGNGYTQNPQAGESSSVFATSTGVGFRCNVSDRLSARFDWGYGFEDLPGSPRSNRAHLGFTWIPGKRP